MPPKAEKSGARPDVIAPILSVLNQASKLGDTIGFFWVPTHVATDGNEEKSRKKRVINKN